MTINPKTLKGTRSESNHGTNEKATRETESR